MTIKEQIFDYARDLYAIEPEFPFPQAPNCAALRHKDSRKIFGLFMIVSRNRLGLSFDHDDKVEILNVKIDSALRTYLMGDRGYLPPYHMHKGSWISILLDGSVPVDEIKHYLKMSFELTLKKSKPLSNKKHNNDWLIPANPKYYDIEKAINEGQGEFIWKQSNEIWPNDIVYLYVASPISAIKYVCKVLKSDIPYSHHDKNVTVKKVMNLQLLHTFNNEDFSIKVLKEHGVSTVRGPRSIPYSLLHLLKDQSSN